MPESKLGKQEVEVSESPLASMSPTVGPGEDHSAEKSYPLPKTAVKVRIAVLK